MPRQIKLIVIHCSDSPNGRTLFSRDTLPGGEGTLVTPVQEIDRWHRERGFVRQQAWRDKQEPSLTSIGYHFVIYTRGAVAACRHVDEIGAHVQGYNADSLGVCLVGRDAFSVGQWDSLRDFLCGLAKSLEQGRPGTPRRFNNPTPAEAREIFARLGVRVRGHRDLNSAKACPNFDVGNWLLADMRPPADKIYTHPLLNPLPGGEEAIAPSPTGGGLG